MTQAEQYKQQQRRISQLEAAAARLMVWHHINSTSGHDKRAKNILRSIDRMDKVDKPVTARKLTAEFDSGGYASKEIVSLDSICKSYGSKTILSDLSLKINRNERIALIGANGCGKTALLKMIMGEEQPDSGEIKISPSIKPAYMSQIITFEDMNATVLDTLRYTTDVPVEKARNILDMTRPVAIQKEKNAQKNPAPKEKPRIRTEKPDSVKAGVSTEKLIHDAEIELEKMNAAIESALDRADFPKLNSL